MSLMFDSTNAADIPSGADAVAGYVGGQWATWAAIVAKFPNLPKLSIAVNASEDAQCLDVESGDATPADVPAWLDRMAKTHPGRVHIIYCPASWIPQVRKAAGSRKYLLWSAHYQAGEHICGGCGFPVADATQFADTGPRGEHVDQTLMTPDFFAAITGTTTTEADMTLTELINALHEASLRSTPAGRQLSDYLQAASGVDAVQQQLNDLKAAVAKIPTTLPSGSAAITTADVHAAVVAALKSVQ